MCWTGNSRKELKELIAKDNIPVTKVVNIGPYNKIFGYFQMFEYELNTVYRLDDTLQLITSCYSTGTGKYRRQGEILRGFHSYASNILVETSIHRVGELIFDYVLTRNSGYEILGRYSRKSRYHELEFNLALADCIIPKGSHYYLNNEGCYVSDCIKIINVYKINY